VWKRYLFVNWVTYTVVYKHTIEKIKDGGSYQALKNKYLTGTTWQGIKHAQKCAIQMDANIKSQLALKNVTHLEKCTEDSKHTQHGICGHAGAIAPKKVARGPNFFVAV